MLKQIIIVNNELGMSKGKIAAQVAHGTVIYVIRALGGGTGENDMRMLLVFNEWNKEGMTKIILKSPVEEIRKLHIQMKEENLWSHKVHDFGRTQVAPNSLTCFIVEPLNEQSADKFFSHLKLL